MGVSNFVEIFDEQYYKDVKGGILEALPDDADWIWFMGDDDEFSSDKSISKVCNLLLQNHQNKNLAFIHACDEKRSKKTGEVVYVE